MFSLQMLGCFFQVLGHVAMGETSPSDTSLFSFHISSPVPANVMILQKNLEGF